MWTFHEKAASRTTTFLIAILTLFGLTLAQKSVNNANFITCPHSQELACSQLLSLFKMEAWHLPDQLSDEEHSVVTTGSDFDWNAQQHVEDPLRPERGEEEEHHHEDDDQDHASEGSVRADEHLEELINDFPDVGEEKLLLKNKNISFYAVRQNFKRQRKFQIEDNLYELLCRVDDGHAPLIQDIKNSLLAALTLLLLEVQNHYDHNDHRQVWITISNAAVEHGVNT